MKSLTFDTGPIISLTLNDLLWILKGLKEKYGGEFYITENVKKELIDKALDTKKYKFEAHLVAKEINENILTLIKNDKISELGKILFNLANNCFYAHNYPIGIVHIGEMEAVACAISNGSDAIVIDERTTRLLIESPETLKEVLEHKLKTDVLIKKENIIKFKEYVVNIKVIRSIELVTIAYKLNLLEKYKMHIKDNNVLLLESLLWGLKLNGCSIREEEIYRILKKEA